MAGARIRFAAVGVGESEPLGQTNSLGELEVDATRLSAGSFLAEAEGFESTERPLPARGTERLSFELEPTPRIHGILRWIDGPPVGEGYRVIVWPTDVSLDGPERLARILAGEEEPGSILWADTDARGVFEISPVQRGMRYRYLAGGSAGLSTDRRVLESSPDPVDLEVKALYGLRLHVRAAEGTPEGLAGGRPIACMSSSRAQGYEVGVVLRESDSRRVFLDRQWLEMPTIEGVRPVDQHLILLSGPYGPDTIDSVHVGVGTLGHAGLSREYPTRRLDLPPLDVHIALERTQDCWGGAEIHFDGLLSLLSGDSGTGRDGTVVATLWVVEQETRKGLTLFLSHPLVSPFALPELPCGVYSVYLASSVGHLAVPKSLDHPILLDVQQGRTSHVTLRAEGFGAIAVEVRFEDGERYEGPLTLMVMQGQKGDMLPFGSPPYSMEGYSPGTYEVQLAELGGRNEWDEQPKVQVDVLADQVVRAVLTVPR